MPESEIPDPRRAGGDEPALDALERAVARMLEELADLRRRSDLLETRYGELTDALGISASEAEEDAGDLGERLQRLAEENRRLREVVGEARDRARRIQSRLRLVEDEL